MGKASRLHPRNWNSTVQAFAIVGAGCCLVGLVVASSVYWYYGVEQSPQKTAGRSQVNSARWLYLIGVDESWLAVSHMEGLPSVMTLEQFWGEVFPRFADQLKVTAKQMLPDGYLEKHDPWLKIIERSVY